MVFFQVMEDDEGIYRLEGAKEEKGGLIIKKKPVQGSNIEFKVPKTSLLGLDKLAGTNVQNLFNVRYEYDIIY